ncbi:MAG: AmmeMemoRadiSam system protein B [Bacteroidetes bacterium]|nr:AmmeMemoRadiSam system protein B [Bacteroidota bacterium]
MAQEIRPIRDNVGFCWTISEMNQLIKYLSTHSTKADDFSSKNLVAAISPHDDYLYAGSVYYPLYKLIKTKEVVIFGVTHGTVRKAMNDPQNVLIFDDYKYWHGPFGNVSISPLREIIKSKLNKNDFMISDKAQDVEHSIEAVVPFLQYYNHEIKITPIMITQMPFDRMEKISDELAGIISDYIKQNNLKLRKDIFFLISIDADHYGKDFDNIPYGEDENAHQKATGNDRRIVKEIFDGTLDKDKIQNLTKELWGTPSDNPPSPVWCGKFSVPFGLLTTNKIIENVSGKKLSGKVFRHSDTWTEGVIPIKHTNLGTTAPFSLKHWCGWFSAGFYLK